MTKDMFFIPGRTPKNCIGFFAVLGIFLIGVVIGTVSCAMMPASQDTTISSYISSALSVAPASKNALIIRAFAENAALCTVIFLLSFTPIGFVSTGTIPALKGFAYGYTCAALIKYYHWKGFFMSTLCLMPKTILQFAALSVFCVMSFNFCSEGIKNTRIRGQTKRFFISSVIVFLLLCFISMCDIYIGGTLLTKLH